MFKLISFLVIFLVYKTYCDPPNPANLAYCEQIPYNPITPCNLTCA